MDNHYYEPDDCFTRHIERAYADRAVHIRRSEREDLGRVYIGERRLGFQSVTLTDYNGAPGSLRAYFYNLVGKPAPEGSGDSRLGALNEPIRPSDTPAFMGPEARLH